MNVRSWGDFWLDEAITEYVRYSVRKAEGVSSGEVRVEIETKRTCTVFALKIER